MAWIWIVHWAPRSAPIPLLRTVQPPSLNGTETSQLYCSADALGSSLIKALNRPNEQGCIVESNTASADIVLKNSTGQKKHQVTCPWNFVHRQRERSSFVCGGHQHYSSKEPQRARVVVGDGDNVRTAALDLGASLPEYFIQQTLLK